MARTLGANPKIYGEEFGPPSLKIMARDSWIVILPLFSPLYICIVYICLYYNYIIFKLAILNPKL